MSARPPIKQNHRWQPREQELWELSARLADQRRTAERMLVGAVLADPTVGVRVAGEAGTQPGDFWSPDLRMIYCACLVSYDHGTAGVLQIARLALRTERMWDATAPAEFQGELWSDAMLERLAGHYYPDHGLSVRVNAKRLIRLSRRQCAAEWHYHLARRLLADDAAIDELDTSTASASVVPVITSSIATPRKAKR